ncbi:MAG TPA: HRDC domain-containing protein [Candidatus Polarisedimenticolia bacterium]|nr:HRDC domain-containing protein [Candidatus Polarisedimenticolia bacterium]
MIFHDSTLMEMVERRPLTREQFGMLGGVGASKLERYADRFLEVLRRGAE